MAQQQAHHNVEPCWVITYSILLLFQHISKNDHKTLQPLQLNPDPDFNVDVGQELKIFEVLSFRCAFLYNVCSQKGKYPYMTSMAPEFPLLTNLGLKITHLSKTYIDLANGLSPPQHQAII